MAYSAGNAYLEIIPSFLNIESMIAKGARDLTKGLDKTLGNALGKVTQSAARQADQETSRAGQALGRTFAAGMLRHVQAAAASISSTDRVLAPLRKELEAIGKIDLTKALNEKEFISRVQQAAAALRRAQQDASGPRTVGRFTEAGRAAGELGVVEDIVRAARERGFAAGDAFSDAYQSRLKAMDRLTPDLLLNARSSDAQRAAAAIKQRIQDAKRLAVGDLVKRDNNPLNLQIGARISGDDIKREMASIEGLLDNFVERFDDVELVLPLDKARQQAGAFFDDIKTQQERAADKVAEESAREQVRVLAKAREAAQREAQQAFARSTQGDIRSGLLNAANRIVELPVHLQANDIDRELAQLRARLRSQASDLQLGVEINAEDFADQVQRQFRRLREIAKDRDVDIDVRVDAARAATELGGILVLLNRIDNDKATVTVETRGTIAGLTDMASKLSLNLGRLGALIAIGSSIGTAIVPAAAAAASTIGAIGTAALASVTGIGVLTLAFSGIGDAVKALGDYAENTQKSNTSLARSANQVAAANDQIKNAEAALANTRRNNRQAAARAQRAIRDALEDQRDAVQDVAGANATAVQRVADAQRDLTRANQDDKEARDRLNEAYREARRALDDLRSQVRGNALDQRQATLDIAKAKEELDKKLANPRATLAEREQAEITYEQRKLQLEDLQRRGAELSDEQDEADRRGIAGSKQVTKARRDIAAADERQLQAQRALDKAQKDLVATQLSGSRKLRDAERRVLDARAAAADQQKDAAYAEFQATQSIVAARRALANATDRNAIAGGSQLDKLQTAMAKLSPTAQQFARYIFGMRDAFYALRGAADPVLAGVQNALESLIGRTSKEAIVRLQPLFDVVHEVATALGGIFERFAATLKGPTFTRLFNYIRSTAVPTLRDMYTAFENILVGVVNLFLAFTPLTKDIQSGFVRMTESFRRWSEGLSQNQGFQDFLAYLRQAGPQIAHLIGEVVAAVAHLVIAAAPVGTVVVDMFTKLVEGINKIPQEALTSLVRGIASAAAAIAVFAGITAIASLSTAGLAAGGIALLVVALSGLAGMNPALAETIRIVAGVAGAVLSLVVAVRVITAVKAAWLTITGLVTAAQTALAAAVTRYQLATVGATTSTGLLNGALFAASGTGATATASMSALSAAMGPLMLIVAGAAGIWAVNRWHMKKANEATDELAPALDELATAARGASNDAAGLARVDEAFRRLISTNQDMRDTVIVLRDLGLGIDTITKAMSGNRDALKLATDAIDAEVERLSRLQLKNFFDLEGNEELSQEQERLWKLRDALTGVADKSDAAAKKGRELDKVQADLKSTTTVLTPAQQALAEAQRVLGDKTSTAQQKMDALTRAQEIMRQASIDSLEAQESFAAGMDDLRSSVQQAKDAQDKHATSLSIHEQTGRRNRDMIEALVQSANRMYDADVALNGVTEAAINKGKDHYDQIRNVARQLKLNKGETEALIAAYNGIPENVETAVGFKKGQFEKLYSQLEATYFIQQGLASGKSMKTIMREYNEMLLSRARVSNNFGYDRDNPRNLPRFATGGRVSGPGTPTSDSIIAKLSRDEHVLTAKEVRAAGGHEAIYALRKLLLSGVKLPGFARGGAVTWPFTVDLARTIIPKVEDLYAGPLGTAGGGAGYRWQMAVLRKVFPGLELISGLRPGARTLSGNRSYHSLGRAVDLPPTRQVAEWIARTFGASTKELITPWRDLMLRNGRPYKYSRAIEAQHGVFGANRHIHWAYENGGLLPDTRAMPGGVMQVFHGRRTPDKVLTDSQWQNMALLANKARQSMAAGDTNNWYFRDSTLDEGKLAAIQARRDALARVNRTNY